MGCRRWLLQQVARWWLGVVGLSQVSVLGARRQARRNWVIISAIGALGFWVGVLGLRLPSDGVQHPDQLVELASGLLGGGVYGLVTGPLLAHLVRHAQQPDLR